MAHDELAVIEGQVRMANPFPHLDDVAASEASSLVTAMVRERTGVDLAQQDPASTASQVSRSTNSVVSSTWRRWIAGGSSAVAARPAWSAAVVAFAAVMLAGVALLVMSPFRSNPPATPTSTTAAVTSTTRVPSTTTPTTNPVDAAPVDVAPTVTPIVWTNAPVTGVESGDRFLSLTETEFGLLAAGVVNEPDRLDEFVPYTDAAVWLSRDGIAWERVGDPSVFAGEPNATGQWGHQWIFDIDAGPRGIVAVGTDGFDAAVWYSIDGVNWERVRSEELEGDGVQELGVVAAMDSGFTAVGTNGSDTAVWQSSDGRTWNALPEGTDSSQRGDLVGVAGEEIIWLTTDGEAWVRTGLSDLPVDPESELGPSGVVAWSDGFLAFGPTGRVWTSNDGVTWTPNATEAFGVGAFNSHTPFAAATDGSQVVVVGATVAWEAAVWTSTVGSDSWAIDTIPGAGKERGPLYDIAHIDGRWIAIGEDTTGAIPYLVIGT